MLTARKKYKIITKIGGRQFNTMALTDGHISPSVYVKSIPSSSCHLRPAELSLRSSRLCKSICFQAIQLIVEESFVLRFERFIYWRSCSIEFRLKNVRNMINLIIKFDRFENHLKRNRQSAALYLDAFP